MLPLSRLCLTRVLSVAICVCTTGVAAADNESHDWLARMAYALEYLNYEGTLIQLQGQDPAVMRIVHRVDGGVPTERITALDEVGREIIRHGNVVTCILPDQRVVLVEDRGPDGRNASPLQKQFASDAQFDKRYYQLAIASGGSLLGRDTRVITVRPTDNYRYGYRLWLDHATAMPLKVQVTAEDGSVVEQLLFTDISLPAQIAESAIQPTLATDSFSWHRSSVATTTDPAAGSTTAWQIGTPPPGFELRAMRTQRRPDAGAQPGGSIGPGTMQQLVLSDGVASVSVFIEGGVTAAEQAEGASRLGAANAYSTMVGNFLVTAMGEVPVRTVEAIAKTVGVAELLPKSLVPKSLVQEPLPAELPSP
ncbi:MAG: MucB/RseB C-terminal domain-containing protein [Gammaproteobacteria bacterium]